MDLRYTESIYILKGAPKIPPRATYFLKSSCKFAARESVAKEGGGCGLMVWCLAENSI